MRRGSSVLTGLLVAVALLVPGPAHAAPAPTEISVAIVVGEGPPSPAGSTFTWYGQLTSGSDPVTGVPVRLMVRPAGATTYSVARTVTSDSSGSLDASVRLTRTTAYYWDYAGSTSYAAAASHAFVQPVGSRVKVATKQHVVGRGGRVLVTGTTTPAQPGKRVSLWRGDVPCFCPGNGATRIGVATVRPDGTFRIVVRFPHAGTKQLFAKVNAGGGNAEGYSSYLRIRVR